MNTNTREQIQLSTNSVYHLNDGVNYKIDRFNQQELFVKFIDDGTVKEKKMSMDEFLKSNPVNFGRL